MGTVKRLVAGSMSEAGASSGAQRDLGTMRPHCMENSVCMSHDHACTMSEMGQNYRLRMTMVSMQA